MRAAFLSKGTLQVIYLCLCREKPNNLLLRFFLFPLFFAFFRSPFIFICSQIYVTLLSGRQFCLLHFPGFVSPPPPVSPKVASTEKRTTYPHLNFHAYGFPTPVPFLTLTGQVSRVFQRSEKICSHPNLI